MLDEHEGLPVNSRIQKVEMEDSPEQAGLD